MANNLYEFDLVRAVQNSTLDKRFSDVETRLHNEQRETEKRLNETCKRIENKLDDAVIRLDNKIDDAVTRLDSRIDRLESKVDVNHRSVMRLLITVLLAVFGIIASTVVPTIISLFQH